jgi:hypothetical protein
LDPPALRWDAHTVLHPPDDTLKGVEGDRAAVRVTWRLACAAVGELLSKVVPLSLGAAFSPTVLALLLVVLTGKRSVARATAFLVGLFVVFAGLTVLGLAISHSTHASPSRADVTRAIDLMAGALLLLLAVGTLLRGLLREPVTHDGPPPKAGHDPGLVSAFLLGLVIMTTNFSTILLYLPAMRAISAARVSDSDKVVAVALALLITMLPVLVVYLLAVLVPKYSKPLLDRMHVFIDRHQRTIGISIEVIFGVYLVVKGLP